MIQLLMAATILYAAACVGAVGYYGGEDLLKGDADSTETVAIAAILFGFVLQILLDAVLLVASMSTL